MRHGLATERGTFAEDDDRPLTPLGEKKTQLVAQYLQELGLSFDRIITSPLVRAQQTAEILLQTHLSSHRSTSAHLAPEGDLTQFLAELVPSKPKANFLAVGHQPDLGDWAEMLIYGAVQGAIVLKKAGIIGLEIPETGEAIGYSQLFWLTSPKLLIPELITKTNF